MVPARTEVPAGVQHFPKGGGVQLFQGEVGVNADFYRNLVIFPGVVGLNPHITAPLDPRMLTLNLLIISTYISDHAVYLNPRPVFTGMTNQYYQKYCFTSDFFFILSSKRSYKTRL